MVVQTKLRGGFLVFLTTIVVVVVLESQEAAAFNVANRFAAIPKSSSTMSTKNRNGFATRSRSSNSNNNNNNLVAQWSSRDDISLEGGMLGEECLITPEGFGFSCPTQRVLKEAGRGRGYYQASPDDRVIDVMEAITSGQHDVALVLDEKGTILGLFTEADYVKVCVRPPQ
jgi:hypothetical protein